jgi:hypothetical protein
MKLSPKAAVRYKAPGLRINDMCSASGHHFGMHLTCDTGRLPCLYGERSKNKITLLSGLNVAFRSFD